MNHLLLYVITEINKRNPVSGKNLKKILEKADNTYLYRANSFLQKYDRYLKTIDKDINYSIDCYLHLTYDMFEERVKFLESGKYSSTSFKEVNKKVYANPDVMDYHMHGLVLAQFLWPEQYKRFGFFADNLVNYKGLVHRYLEIGGGHALYVDTAVNIIGPKTTYDLVDISNSSLNIARGILNTSAINFIHKDIFDFEESKRYDFITMGEVLEHLERPEDMLRKIYDLLADDGTFYLTTPANAPMIDHIYLFNDENEIRQLITDSGFVIKEDMTAFSKGMSLELARELKIPLMYAAFLNKNIKSLY